MVVGVLSFAKLGFAAQPAESDVPEASPSAIPRVLTLQAAIELAKTNNPRIQASDSRVAAAAGRAWQAGRWSNPELEFAVEEWPVSGGGGFSDSKQTIGVAQTLPWPGKKRLDRQIGGAGIQLSEAGLYLRLTEVVRDVKAAFYGVLMAERSLEVGEDLLRVAGASSDAARKRVEAGATSYQEQLRAEIQLEQAQTEVAGLRRTVATARQMLVTQLGRPDLVDVPLIGALTEQANQALLSSFKEDWLSSHPSMAAAQANLNRAELEYRRARLEPYPNVKAGVAGGRLGDTDESIVEFALSIPLPILNTSKGLKSEAAANVSVAEAQLMEVQLELQREAETALKRYRTAIDQVASYRERIVPKTARALDLVQTGFTEGKFSFMDLLDTQRTFGQTQMAYQRKLLELSIAQAALEALLNPSTNPDTTHNQ